MAVIVAFGLVVSAILAVAFLPSQTIRMIVNGLAVYFVIWWLVLFAVLPLGVRSQAEEGEVSPGTDPGAPVAPQMGRKIFWTTGIAALVFAAFYAALPYVFPD
jgi:predicted secreted protein